jgi:hypothetical protein
MICLPNLVFESGLDLNVESQTLGLSRISAQNRHAPRQARICATHALSATKHVSPLCGRPLRRTQGQGNDFAHMLANANATRPWQI